MSPSIYSAPQWLLTLLAVVVVGDTTSRSEETYLSPFKAPDSSDSVFPASSVSAATSSDALSGPAEDPCRVRSLEGAEVAGIIAYLRVRLTVADPAKCRATDDRKDWQVALVPAGSEEDVHARYRVSKEHLEVQLPHAEVGDFQLLVREPLPVVSPTFHLDRLKYQPHYSVIHRDSSLVVSFTTPEEKLNASFDLLVTPCGGGEAGASASPDVCRDDVTVRRSDATTFLVNGSLANPKCNFGLTLVMWSGFNGTRVKVEVEDVVRGAKRTCFLPTGDADAPSRKVVARPAYVAWWVTGVVLAVTLLILTLLICRRRLLRESQAEKESLDVPRGGPEVLLVYSRKRMETIVVQALARTLEFHFGCQVKDLYSYSDPVQLTAPQSWAARKVTCPSSKVLLLQRLGASSTKPSYARDPFQPNGTQHKRELDRDDKLFRYTLQSLREAELSSCAERVFVAKVHVEETLARDFVVDDEVEDEEETLSSSLPGPSFLLPQHMALLGAALRGRTAKDEEVPLCVEDPTNFPHLTLALGSASITPTTTTITKVTSTTPDAVEVAAPSRPWQRPPDAVTV